LALLGADLGQRRGIEPEALAHRASCERERVLAWKTRAGGRLGQLVPHLADRAAAIERDAPLLRACRDRAVEARIADFPHRRRQLRADQLLIGRRSRFAPDEDMTL